MMNSVADNFCKQCFYWNHQAILIGYNFSIFLIQLLVRIVMIMPDFFTRRLIFPNSQRMNRGGYEMSQLIHACRANEVTDFIVVHEHRGVPDSLVSSGTI